ncbi:MAG: HAD family hydrolase [Planctomycetes bacterium]|nr:HAD family hydrolase [Planctomycetota bacterium]
MDPIRAVLFDFGDTLIRFGDVDRSALFRRAAERTYQMWAQRQERMPGFERYYLHQWFAIRWGYVKLKLMHREADAMHSIRRACRKLWLNAPEDFFDELAWNWYRPLAEVADLEPGTRETLADLRRRGYRMAIVSNTFVPGFVIDRHLGELGLLEFFPQRVYSCDVGYRKPDRRIFHEALGRVGVRPDEAVFVGDLLDADVEGARRAGMRAVWKRNGTAGGEHPDSKTAIDSIAELPAALHRLTRVAVG